MGQFALGLRSLLFRAAIFVVMAALLAWALGGTLWPRAETAEGPSVSWNGATWRLRLAVGGDVQGQVRWTLMRQEGSERAEPWRWTGFDRWVDAAGPVVADGRLYVAFRDADSEDWTLATIADAGVTTVQLPDRLEVERQLARLRNGLPAQPPGEALKIRDSVLRLAPPADA